jgi:hypothetical protein
MITGVVAVVLVAAMDPSPLSPALAQGTGSYPPFSTVARALGLNALTGGGRAAASIFAVVAVTAAFLWALRAAWRGAFSVRLVAGVGIAFVVVGTALPLLMSRDAYSYTMYGRIASIHHANPYVAVPADFSGDPVFPLVGPEWRHTPAVYGPAFTLLSAGITTVLKGVAADVWAFKVLAGAAGVAVILLVARAAKGLWPGRAPFAVALVAWNPAFVFDTVGSGHNDVLVALAVAAAVVALAGPPSPDGATGRARAFDPVLKREVLASGFLTAGALVKAPAAIPLALLVLASVWRRRGSRVQAAAAHGAVIGGLVALFGWPFFQAKDPTLGLATLATHLGWLAPTRLFRVVLGDAARSLGGTGAGDAVEALVRLAFAAAFAVVFILLARRTIQVAGRWGGERGDGPPLRVWASVQGAQWAWGLLLFTLLSPVLLPWYAAWVLPVAWLMPEEGVAGAAALSALLAVSETIAEPLNLHHPDVYGGMVLTGHYVLTPALCVVLGWLLVRFVRRLRTDAPLEGRADPGGARVPVRAGGGPAAADQERGQVAGQGHRDPDGESGAGGERDAHPVGDQSSQEQGGRPGRRRQGDRVQGIVGRRERPAQPGRPERQE